MCVWGKSLEKDVTERLKKEVSMAGIGPSQLICKGTISKKRFCFSASFCLCGVCGVLTSVCSPSGVKGFRRWQARFVTLDSEYLHYFKKEGDAKPKVNLLSKSSCWVADLIVVFLFPFCLLPASPGNNCYRWRVNCNLPAWETVNRYTFVAAWTQ